MWSVILVLSAFLGGPVLPSDDLVAQTQPRCRSEAEALDDLFAADLQVPVFGVGSEDLVDTFAMVRPSGHRHEALDILAPQGRRVFAVADGEITRVGTNNIGGNVVFQLDESRCVGVYYAHLDDWAPGLRPGPVKKGDLLGFVGETGNARGTQPHLHLGVYHLKKRGKFTFTSPMNPHRLFIAPEHS